MTASAPRTLPHVDLGQIHRVYFMGICGTGMGALAAMLKTLGLYVWGSDPHPYPPMSTYLSNQGIEILQGWNPHHLLDLSKDKVPDLVVVGNICRKDNVEVLAASSLGIPQLSFPETLRLYLIEPKSVHMVVSGTHGKTTTSSMLAWILYRAGLDPSFMIGGMPGNFDNNFRVGQGPIALVEGDEYDSAFFDKVPKFWHYQPTHLAINNIEYDHADIYPDLFHIEEVFATLIQNLPPCGRIYVNAEDPVIQKIIANAKAEVQTLGLQRGLWQAKALRVNDQMGISFRIYRDASPLIDIDLPVPGSFNVRNALMATAMAFDQGIDPTVIHQALAQFKPVKKRQEKIGTCCGIAIYDDFAHHPTAVRQTIMAFRELYPHSRLWVIFEIKSNTSRRAVFQHHYAKALALADQVVLSKPWKKDDLPKDLLLDFPKLLKEIREQGTPAIQIPDVDDIVDWIVPQLRFDDVVLVMSGSHFQGLHQKLFFALKAYHHSP